MHERTVVEQEAIDAFLIPSFSHSLSSSQICDEERLLVASILQGVETQFNPLTYVLGLALDFTLLAQKISHHDSDAKLFRPNLTEEAIMGRYDLVTARGKKQVNTLTFKYANKSFGIRRIEEAVCDLFIKTDRTGYPSAYVYNTGMWHHYKGLLLDCFRLSEPGRFLLCNTFIDFGLARFSKNIYFGRTCPRFRLFEEIVKRYPRSGADENSGMVAQGIAYGYLNADRPHLSLIVDKVRTGSAKQRRFGDIDGYFGLDLEVSVEVKDDPIFLPDVVTELGHFLRDVSNHRVQGLVFARSIDDPSRDMLKLKGVSAITNEEMLASVEKWDWRKQDSAVHGLLHFVAHVEQNPKAVRRLLEFIRSMDDKHDSLAYFVDDSSK